MTASTSKTSQNLSAANLIAMSLAELIELFTTLEAPTMQEINGEFDGTPLRQPTLPRGFIAALKIRNPLHLWKRKGFRQIDEKSGRGYNVYRRSPGGKLIYRDPMTTRMVTSHIDGKPAFQLDYRTFDTFVGVLNLVDDVRRVAPGFYLGFGMLGFTDKQRSVLQPFMLEATSRPYLRDVGVLRSEQRHGDQLSQK